MNMNLSTGFDGVRLFSISTNFLSLFASCFMRTFLSKLLKHLPKQSSKQFLRKYILYMNMSISSAFLSISISLRKAWNYLKFKN